MTKVNKNLLEGSSIKFVGTATSGTDHIDLEYLRKKEIAFASAPGCNSQAVAEYIFSAIIHIAYKNKIKLSGKSIGIIGVGNIGSKINKIARKFGIKTIKNDPPLKRKSGNDTFKSLKDALSADIITFHVPLNMGGIDNTYHLLNKKNLNLLKPGTILLNASRGPVIDNIALKNHLLEKDNLYTVLDVWENEPAIDLELLNLVNIGTPHIAGYSFEGKVKGTVMIYKSLCDFLDVPPFWTPTIPAVENRFTESQLNFETLEDIYNLIHYIYPIDEDSSQLKKSVKMPRLKAAEYFDLLRKNYKMRRESNSFNFNFSIF